MSTKYRLNEFLIINWSTPIFDFTKSSADIEYCIQKRVYGIFWKTIETFEKEVEAKQRFDKHYAN